MAQLPVFILSWLYAVIALIEADFKQRSDGRGNSRAERMLSQIAQTPRHKTDACDAA